MWTMIHPSDADRLAGAVVMGAYGAVDVPPVVVERLRKGLLAGVTLFRRNLSTVETLLTATRLLSAAYPDDLPSPLLAIDQEGGRVARLGPPVVTLPPMRRLGQAGDVGLTRRAGTVLGEELSALGLNLDFAPVCDVDSNPANPIIGDRSFGADPETVSRHAAAFSEGLQSAGVAGCAKHFPGHGDTSTDSHLELPVLPHDRARLDRVELPPFRAAFASGVASVMTAHVRFDALDPEVPATLSRRVVEGLLRNELAAGRDDLVIVSDDLQMKAVSARWGVGEAAVAAVNAGCDLLLVCVDPDEAEAARQALVRRAEADGDFAARLARSAGRVTAMRRRYPSRPVDSVEAVISMASREARRALDDALRVVGGSSIDGAIRGGVQ